MPRLELDPATDEDDGPGGGGEGDGLPRGEVGEEDVGEAGGPRPPTGNNSVRRCR